MRIKILFLLCVFPLAGLAAQKSIIPFFVDEWERISKCQFESVIDADADAADISATSFWRSYSPEQIKEEAIAFLGVLSRSGGFEMVDPAGTDFTVSAIRFERLRYLPRDEGRSWYLVVQLSGWGKAQMSGVPLAIQIVMIPGRGFKTPLLRREPIHAPQQQRP